MSFFVILSLFVWKNHQRKRVFVFYKNRFYRFLLKTGVLRVPLGLQICKDFYRNLQKSRFLTNLELSTNFGFPKGRRFIYILQLTINKLKISAKMVKFDQKSTQKSGPRAPPSPFPSPFCDLGAPPGPDPKTAKIATFRPKPRPKIRPPAHSRVPFQNDFWLRGPPETRPKLPKIFKFDPFLRQKSTCFGAAGRAKLPSPKHFLAQGRPRNLTPKSTSKLVSKAKIDFKPGGTLTFSKFPVKNDLFGQKP